MKCLTLYAKKQMPKIKCQRNVNMIYQVNQSHAEKVMKYKKVRRKVNLLQCPSSLKHLNFKMECLFYTNSIHP